MNDTATNYQQLLTEALQKQMVILGPNLALTKARHVQGLTVSDDGHVTAIDGNPQEVSIKLLEQFRELSPIMVKKTMKPLLDAIIASYPKTPMPTTQEAAPTSSDQPPIASDHDQEQPSPEHEEAKPAEPSAQSQVSNP